MRFLLILLSLSLFGFSPGEKSRTQLDFLNDYLSIRYPSFSFDQYIFVEVKKQKMHVIENGQVTKSYDISTAKNGVGNLKDSECTPKGLLKISNKIGINAPIGGIIQGRGYIGKKATILSDSSASEEDLITSRALRLSGLEPGKNKGGETDTYHRQIYIHGTDEEGLIGQPVSHGCIRMKNEDVIEFFDLVTIGTKVLVLNL